MFKFLVLFLGLTLTGCMTVPGHPSIYAYEKFEVEKKCVNMKVLHVDNCHPDSIACIGYVAPEGSKEVFYTSFHNSNKEGDIARTCYTHRVDNGQQVGSYFDH